VIEYLEGRKALLVRRGPGKKKYRETRVIVAIREKTPLPVRWQGCGYGNLGPTKLLKTLRKRGELFETLGEKTAKWQGKENSQFGKGGEE